MRPLAGAPPAPPYRKSSIDGEAAPSGHGPPASGAPTSFLVASESEIDGREGRKPAREAGAAGGWRGERPHDKSALLADSTFGVRSLNEGDELEGAATLRPVRRQTAIRTVDAAGGDPPGVVDPSRGDASASAAGRDPSKSSLPRDPSSDSLRLPLSGSSASSSPTKELPRRLAGDAAPPALTPLSFASPLLGSSAPSSPKSVSMRSFRPSDDDDFEAGSQAIASSEDEAEALPIALASRDATAQQLIMPSITMPSRRPFTARGKNMGRLKVLVVGAAGTLVYRPKQARADCLCRHGQDVSDQVHRADLRGHCTRRRAPPFHAASRTLVEAQDSEHSDRGSDEHQGISVVVGRAGCRGGVEAAKRE